MVIQMRTSIRLPREGDVEFDTEGFDIGDMIFGDEIPAVSKDITYKSQVNALQLGLYVTKEFEINTSSYHDEGFLQDCTDGRVYDIQRVFHPDNKKTVILQCSKMRPVSNGLPYGG